MTDDHKDKGRTVISANAARGAKGPEEGTVGDTLLPMLIALILFTAIGVAIVAYSVIA